MSDLQIAPKADMAKKREAWAKIGEAVSRLDMELQATAQAAIQSIVHPKGISEVKRAEELLSASRAIKVELENKRKELTLKFDKVSSRLMLPEKGLEEPIKKLSESIIAIKKEEQLRIDKEKKSAAILNKMEEYISSEFSRADAHYKNKILSDINSMYVFALEYVAPHNIDPFLNLKRSHFSHGSFNFIPLGKPEYKGLDAEFKKCVLKCATDASFYLGLYQDELQKKFSDYEVAYQNKEQALQISADEEEKKKAEIKAESQNAQLSFRLTAAAQPLTPQITTEFKALRKSYEIDMPETVMSVMAIMAAFSSHLQLCLPKLKVNKWFAFTPAQAATALCKVKAEDVNFHPLGITFKEVDKL